jgi:hypothetical protein
LKQASDSNATIPEGNTITPKVQDFKNATNNQVPNWILGDQTLPEYTEKLFDFITNNNYTKCPKETPFV